MDYNFVKGLFASILRFNYPSQVGRSAMPNILQLQQQDAKHISKQESIEAPIWTIYINNTYPNNPYITPIYYSSFHFLFHYPNNPNISTNPYITPVSISFSI